MRVSKEKLKEELEAYRKQMQRERTIRSKDLFDVMKQEIHGDGVQEAWGLWVLDAEHRFQQFINKIREAEQALEED